MAESNSPSIHRSAASERTGLNSGLDFVVSTEHNTSAANRCWGAEELSGLLVVPKLGPTPPGFPRRPGAARKRPL